MDKLIQFLENTPLSNVQKIQLLEILQEINHHKESPQENTVAMLLHQLEDLQPKPHSSAAPLPIENEKVQLEDTQETVILDFDENETQAIDVNQHSQETSFLDFEETVPKEEVGLLLRCFVGHR